MHGDLSPHLHTDECNAIVDRLIQCRINNPYMKYLGACNDIDFAMTKCFRKERMNKMALNVKKRDEKQKEVSEKLEAMRVERRKMRDNSSSDNT